MSIGPDHAFANGPARPAMSRSSYLWRLAARVGRPLARSIDAYRFEEAWRSFSAVSEIANDCLLGSNARCINTGEPSRVRVGRGSVCRGVVRRESFGNGEIVIGEAVYIGDDCLLSCSARIEIGPGAMLAHGVQVFDNTSHPLGRDTRAADWETVRRNLPAVRDGIESAAVTIGAGAWIGFGTIVLMGVTVGEGAVVGAGSVVTRDVRPFAIAVGNTAQEISEVPR